VALAEGTHRLVRSERVGDKVRQVTLLNLGRHFAVAQSDWPTLCARLEELLSGQEALLGGLLVEREAQRLAALLLVLSCSLVMHRARTGSGRIGCKRVTANRVLSKLMH